MAPTNIPPKISVGQWTPTATRPRPIRMLPTKNQTPARRLINQTAKTTEKKAIWPEGKELVAA